MLAGIEEAQVARLNNIKVNAVIKRGSNDQKILELVEHFRSTPIVLRFIEYMDVGETNGWRMDHVVPAREIRDMIESEFPLRELVPTYAGEGARRYGFGDGSGEVGIIASVTQPFCGGCTRLRLSAEGRLYTCLFAAEGMDVRSLLRRAGSDEELSTVLGELWQARSDRYSEERGRTAQHKVEMSYIGG